MLSIGGEEVNWRGGKLAVKKWLHQTADDTGWIIRQCRSILQAATNPVTDWHLCSIYTGNVTGKAKGHRGSRWAINWESGESKISISISI